MRAEFKIVFTTTKTTGQIKWTTELQIWFPIIMPGRVIHPWHNHTATPDLQLVFSPSPTNNLISTSIKLRLFSFSKGIGRCVLLMLVADANLIYSLNPKLGHSAPFSSNCITSKQYFRSERTLLWSKVMEWKIRTHLLCFYN